VGWEMRNIRIAIQVKKAKDAEGKEVLKVSVPMRLMFEEDFDADWLDRQLKKFEEEYIQLVANLNKISKQVKSTRGKGKVLLYWKFGDETVKFMEQNEKGVLFLENVTRNLVRDVGVSDKMLTRCRKLRLLYPDILKVDPNRSFDSYISMFEGGYISAKRRQERETEAKHA